MKIRLHSQAEDDLVAGYRFYESRSQGIGDYFLDSLLADIESLQLYAGVHETHFGYHRLLSRRFPYAVYYRLNGDTALVYAVLDMRRSPRSNLARLGESSD